MAPRVCICTKEIPMDPEMGPVAGARLYFYVDASHFGRPTSRQRAFFCDECAPALIEFLKERQNYGPGVGEVSE